MTNTQPQNTLPLLVRSNIRLPPCINVMGANHCGPLFLENSALESPRFNEMGQVQGPIHLRPRAALWPWAPEPSVAPIGRGEGVPPSPAVRLPFPLPGRPRMAPGSMPRSPARASADFYLRVPSRVGSALGPSRVRCRPCAGSATAPFGEVPCGHERTAVQRRPRQRPSVLTCHVPRPSSFLSPRPMNALP